MITSPSIATIMPAFLKAQEKMGSAKKGSLNPYFKSKYADLGSVMEVCKDALNENGIAVLQPVIGGSVTTVLLHTSGEYISDEGTPIICSKPNDPQAQGSAITYARRYGLQSMLFIPAEDDDAEKAMDRTSTTKTTGTSSIPPCTYHNVPMKLNKNGTPYHYDEQRGFCNGSGFQDEHDEWKNKNKGTR